MSDEITEQEAQELIRSFSESKATMHTFFRDVVKTSDTLKVGNLSPDELGMSALPVRSYKELALFCEEVANQPQFTKYFDAMSEIQTASSLSKEGFLMKLSVTQKKELKDTSPEKKSNRGWFKKKDDQEQSG